MPTESLRQVIIDILAFRSWDASMSRALLSRCTTGLPLNKRLRMAFKVIGQLPDRSRGIGQFLDHYGQLLPYFGFFTGQVVNRCQGFLCRRHGFLCAGDHRFCRDSDFRNRFEKFS